MGINRIDQDTYQLNGLASPVARRALHQACSLAGLAGHDAVLVEKVVPIADRADDLARSATNIAIILVRLGVPPYKAVRREACEGKR